jgi:two-component system chemotaxis sensor kinase CheA
MIDLSLLEDFVSGAGESLDEMETALLELEISPNNNELLHTIFRATHTIKGAAQFVGLEKVSALSHALEDLLDLLREGKKSVTLELIDLFIQTKDRISLLVIDLEKTKSEITEVNDLIEKIKVHLHEDVEQTPLKQSSQQQISEESEEIDLADFLAEDTTTDAMSSFLADQEDAELDLSAFLSEDNDNEEDNKQQSSPLLVEQTQATWTEESKPDDSSTFLSETTEQIEFLDTSVEASESDEIILPSEEHDQELFGIYLQQLREKTTLLSDIVSNLSREENKVELLTVAIDALENLKFSANYMGYEKLTRLYDRWINELQDAQENWIITGDVSFAFMMTYLAKLQQIFPQLSAETESYQQEAKQQRKDLEQATETAIDALDKDKTASLAFMEDFLTQDVQPQVASNEAENQPSADVLEDDDYLFAKLSHALDSSIERSITSEPINEVFSALLAVTNEQNANAIKEEKERTRLKVKTLAEANQEPEPKQIFESVQNKTTVGLDAVGQSMTMTEKTITTPITDKALKKSIRVDADKIDSLMNQVGELIVDRAYFFQLANEINELQRYLKEVTGLAQKDLKPVRTFAYRFSEAIISLGRTSNELQEGVMKIRMLPIAQLFNRYPRLVHDLAHTNGKKVQLEIRGEETELDKMIIEEISDPLIHMIRNAIGHGIETPEVRRQLGKPETGTLILEAYHESNHIVIEVTDDGRGIDPERIRAKAEELALFSSEELNRLSADDLTRFIMLPGFSTAKEVDSTSGRGVGMDVVKKHIEKLNGTIEVESKLGVETKIRLKIPLTLAIIQALLVRVGEDSFTIPLVNVEETLRVTQHEISIMEDTEVMYLRGKTLPIFRLSVLFNLHSTQKSEQHNFFVVVVNTGNQKIGLMVDALLGQEEVVIKPLVDYLHEQNCFSGATIVGDGRISLILDVYELINMATEKQVQKHHDQEQRSIASLEGSA